MTATLDGAVAVVTGATRGIGKGIALELGTAGASVYVTGRTTSRRGPLPGTLRETADEIEALGGTAVPVVCDHRDDAQVRGVFERVASDHGQLNILVNNVYSAIDLVPWLNQPFWQIPTDSWDQVIGIGARSHYVASALGAPLMLGRTPALIVNISSSGSVQYAHNVVYGVGKAAVDKMTADMAHELRPHGVAVVSLWPGLVRTELTLMGAEKTPDGREVLRLPGAGEFDLGQAETPRFCGRAVVALASAPDVMARTGKTCRTGELARAYGFTDVDGRVPEVHVRPPAEPDTRRRWVVASIEELQHNLSFTTGGKSVTGRVTFLPEPQRRPRRYLVISADDHVVEPPHTFEGRLPAALAARGPRVVEKDDGTQVWAFDGQQIPNVGFNAVVGRPVSEYSFEPARFDEMRRGAWDIHERIRDMDINGVYASVNFPSFLPGFCGQRLQLTTRDPDLALALVRAWNDWHLEEWAGSYPERIIPCQIPYLLDPEAGAAEIVRNAERGFKSVTFSEGPQHLGLPSLHTGHWDPLLRACAETDTVVNLHIGSSGISPSTADDAPPDVIGVLFFGYAMFAAVDWLYSRVPVRFPDIRICMSEGGIGWVAGLLDRLDHMLSYHGMYGTWAGIEMTPAEILKRNFWFCAVEDQSSFALRERIGVGHVLVESDYPHCDSTWPDTQRVLEEELAGIPLEDVERITWRNAAELYRHPVPTGVQVDPNSY